MINVKDSRTSLENVEKNQKPHLAFSKMLRRFTKPGEPCREPTGDIYCVGLGLRNFHAS